MNTSRWYLSIAALTGILLIPGCWQPKQPVIAQTQAPAYDENLHTAMWGKKSKDLTPEEATYARSYHLSENDPEHAAHAIERLMALSDYEQTGPYLLELAHLYEHLENYPRAEKLFKEYKTIYPGNKQFKEACYHEIVAAHAQILPTNRDQKKTHETIEMIKNFLQEFPHDEEYTPLARGKLSDCYKILLKSELEKAQFYLNKYNYTEDPQVLISAYNRLVYAHKEVLPELVPYNQALAIVDEELGQLEKPSVITYDTQTLLYRFIQRIEQALIHHE